jgi:hypothetical protein
VGDQVGEQIASAAAEATAEVTGGRYRAAVYTATRNDSRIVPYG